MPYTVKFDPSVVSLQAGIIPDATENKAGVVTLNQVKALVQPGPPGPVGPPGPAGSGGILFWGADNLSSTITTRFLLPGYDQSGIAPTISINLVIPRNGTLRNLFVRHNANAGNGNPIVYTVLLNGVATPISVSLATGVVGQAGDTVNTVAVAQGDRVSIRVTKAVAIGSGSIQVTATIEVA